MSEFSAIRAVSQTLQELLESGTADLGVTVHLLSPKELQADGDTGISLWLYRITRNEYVWNQPPQRPASGQVAYRPVPVNLHYLITPLTGDAESEQMLLGRILQVLNDNPSLRGAALQDPLPEGNEELRIALDPLSLEELTRIWSALQEPYQTSLTYEVHMIHIDSRRDPRAVAPVTTRESTYAQIVAAE